MYQYQFLLGGPTQLRADDNIRLRCSSRDNVKAVIVALDDLDFGVAFVELFENITEQDGDIIFRALGNESI